MDRRFFLAFWLMLCRLVSSAVVAFPEPQTFEQPDGTSVTLLMHGDEFNNWATTTDGFPVIRNQNGEWTYATLNAEGTLVTSGIMAHDLNSRGTQERNLLTSLPAWVIPTASAEATERKKAARNMATANQANTDYQNFRGLIILAEFSDRKFSREDTYDIFQAMVNQPGYDGYMTDAMIPVKEEYTGSVRDYFYDNSMGVFDPHFDIVGPVTINYSETYINQSAMAQQVIAAVCTAADPLVDFSLYDTNGDNVVDMFYVIFAGYGSNYDSSQRYVWPHASTLMNARHDGVSLGRYACSTEFYGTPSNRTLDGIGTICHEFSHVLGLMDEYDTDYASSGGQSIHPAKWSLMASGSYLNKGRTPCGYSLYQRILSGFATAEPITDEGTFSLGSLDTSNTGYRIDSSVENEFFIIENRQQTKWDAHLPGHGMLIHRVDLTDETVWSKNNINVNPAHNYYELLRANPAVSSSGSVTDSDGDPYPGSGMVTAINNETTPSLKSWSGLLSDIGICDIAEDDEGIIHFTTVKGDFSILTEDWEDVAFEADDETRFTGKITGWQLDNASIEETDAIEGVSGNAVAIVRKGTLTSDAIQHEISQVTFTAANPTSSTAMLRFSYSADNGTTWNDLKTTEGNSFCTLRSNSHVTAGYVLEGLPLSSAGHRIRITEYTGSTTEPCLIDDLRIKVKGGMSVLTDFPEATPKSGRLSASAANGIVTIRNASAGTVEIFSTDGKLIARCSVSEGMATASLPGHGIAIIRSGADSCKTAY